MVILFTLIPKITSTANAKTPLKGNNNSNFLKSNTQLVFLQL